MASETPTFGLRLGGDLYEGWTEISVTRDLTRMSGEFSLQLSRKTATGEIPQVTPGRAAAVEIDGNPILKGWLDVKGGGYDKSRMDLTVTGRDKLGDLIDCAATVDGPFEYNKMPLDKVVARICKPFGIEVKSDLGTVPIIKRFAIQPGESAFDFIERACRASGVLPVSDGIGGLVLTRPASERSPGALVYGQNILSADVTIDATERHSLYVVKGQAEAADGGTDAKQMAGAEGRVTDTEVTRYRPKVLVGENQGYSGTLKDRALWERKADRARGTKATYVTQGWYATAKTLWKPNTLVKVTDPILDINRDLLITGITFSRGAQGTLTRLELALPEAFDIDTKAAKDDSGKGTDTLWADDNG
jgi:prophage tail gpP-like protein